MRLSIWVLLFTLATGCAGRARKPAMAIGGAMVLGGTAAVVKGATHDCEGDGGLADLCNGMDDMTVFGGAWIAAVGASLLVLSALRDGRPIAPTPPAVRDPSSPPPAMDPEPASW